MKLFNTFRFNNNSFIKINEHDIESCLLVKFFTAAGRINICVFNELKQIIADAKIIDASKLKTDAVQILNKVKLKNLKNGATMSYTIVSDTEANLKQGKISVNTPIAKGLLGKKVGDQVAIKVPSGIINLEILDISF